MNIAIVTPGGLPVPPVKGGAIENLIFTLINENESSDKPINIDVYGIEDEFNEVYNTNQIHTKYYFVKKDKKILKNKFITKISNKINYSYFLNQTICKIKNKKYDYIVVENRPNYVKRINKKNSSKIVLHMHNEHLTSEQDYKEVVDICNSIIVVSEYIKKRIIDKYNVDSNKIKVLHNGINTNKFCKSSLDDRLSLRKKFRLNEEDFVVLFSGRLSKEKGVLELIKSFEKIDKNINIKLLIVGAKWFGKNVKDEFIENLAKVAKGMEDRIIFTGYIDYNEVSKIYSMADIAVLPSIWDDPLPLTVLECMSVGLPIISTISGGIPEMVDETCGILLERDEKLEENLANKIEFLYYNDSIRMKMSEAARKNVKEQFTNNHFYNSFKNILNNN